MINKLEFWSFDTKILFLIRASVISNYQGLWRYLRTTVLSSEGGFSGGKDRAEKLFLAANKEQLMISTDCGCNANANHFYGW